MELKHISSDTSKHVFTLHGVDGEDRVVLRRELRRGQVDTFFTRAAPTEIALEACAGSHRMGRTFRAMGHQVKLIPPQYVKPFVKRSKNDRNDAQAINEAASRPSMRTVPVRTVDEQAATMIVKHREMLVGQRTQAINALRGHATEFGIVAAKGCGNVAALVCCMSNDPGVPAVAKSMFAQMAQHITELDGEIMRVDQQLHEQHKASPLSQCLATIPGVGPIIAITMALSINPTNFESGRHFAAWLGLRLDCLQQIAPKFDHSILLRNVSNVAIRSSRAQC